MATPSSVLFLWDVFFDVFFVERAVLPVGWNFSINEGIASTLFDSSLTLLEVGSMVFRANDGDNDDKGGYNAEEDALNLKREVSIKVLFFFSFLERKRRHTAP